MSVKYLLRPSRFGDYIIVWVQEEGCPLISRIFLSAPGESALQRLEKEYPSTVRGAAPRRIEDVADCLDAFLSGAEVRFDPGILYLSRCSAFQRRVLLEESRIPRGQVATYSRIASLLGIPGAARAVGGALARNPFPLIVPCHRAIRSDGTMGGFQGGLAMKRELLEYEVVRFTPDGKAPIPPGV